MALLKRKRSGLGDAMDVVTKFVNACNRHDADGVYACLHPDFDSIQPMYPSRNFRGADQVRRNWQAIFDAEPGFRLTVLRSAAMDDTIWLELHGAGRDAEVAGVFVMGVQGDRIRWARIYSALVEPVPAGVADQPAPGLREVPPYQEEGAPAAEPAPADGGEVVEESLIAPVLDMDRPSRRRRRGRRGSEEEGAGGEPAGLGQEVAAEEVSIVNADAAGIDVSDADAVVVVDAAPAVDVTVEVEPDTEVVVVTDEAVPDAEAAVVEEQAPATTEDGGPTEAVDTGRPGTSSSDMVTITEEPGAEREVAVDQPVVVESTDPEPDRDPEPPRRLFGRKKP
jgi:limonene-1,2-epoxide hydrolase